MFSGAGQALGPPSGATCHLQNVTGGAESFERRFDLRDLPGPLYRQVCATVVAATPLPPLVVLRCTRPIERFLLGQ